MCAGGSASKPKSINISLPDISPETPGMQPLGPPLIEPIDQPRDLRTGKKLQTLVGQNGNNLAPLKYRNDVLGVSQLVDEQQRRIDAMTKDNTYLQNEINWRQEAMSVRNKKFRKEASAFISESSAKTAANAKKIADAQFKIDTMVSSGGSNDPKVKALAERYADPNTSADEKAKIKTQLDRIRTDAETLTAQQGISKQMAKRLGIKIRPVLEQNDKTIIRGENVTTVNLNAKGQAALQKKAPARTRPQYQMDATINRMERRAAKLEASLKAPLAPAPTEDKRLVTEASRQRDQNRLETLKANLKIRKDNYAKAKAKFKIGQRAVKER